MRLDRPLVTQMLTEAGCVAAGEEADELIRAAAGDPDVLDDLVSRRTNGEPIAWLTGAVTFCGVELLVEPGVYVPRWQTEALARRAVTLLPVGGSAADLCTGGAQSRPCWPLRCQRRRWLRPSSTRLRCDVPDGTASRCSRAFWTIRCREARAPRRRVDGGRAVRPTGSLRLLPRDVQTFEPRLALEAGLTARTFSKRSREGAWVG